ncbi:MAG: flagellin [Gammaproteobacteria bacterium]|nr:flagellin [Gammaproteobacteria bacterium]
MPQVINTNVLSLNSQRALNRSQDTLRIAVQRLSSGLRLNSAKDDAAGLAITERFTAQINGLNQAARNASDGISLAQTAEGALAEVASNLQRMRVLAVQSANATNSPADRLSLNDEIRQLQAEIVRVFDGTNFNQVYVFATNTTFPFQVGPNWQTSTNQITVSTAILKSLATLQNAISAAATISTVAGSLSAIARFDIAINEISERRATWGTIQNRFESVVRNAQNMAENLSASRSRIQDADFAVETAELTRSQILQQAGTAMLAQANAIPQNVLSLLQ